MSPISIADRPSAKPTAEQAEAFITEVRLRRSRRRDELDLPKRYDFWMPGDAAISRSPELAEVLEYRDDHSFVLEQAPQTGTLIHIPLLQAQDEPSRSGRVMEQILFFTLAAKLNKYVRLDLLSLYYQGKLIYCQPVDLEGRDYDIIFDALPANRPNRIYDIGVMLEMHLTFLPGAERGRIELRGVGSGFA